MDYEKRFEVLSSEEDGGFYQLLLKILLISLLGIGVFLLGAFAYKFLKGDESSKTLVTNKQQLSQQEIAIIVQTVIAQMQKNQASLAKNAKKSEDSELLNSLQSVKLEDENKKVTNKPKNIVAKKVQKSKEPEFIKKEIVYNAVVIGNKEIKSTSDLARLYASINRISRSKKRKLLKSAYTKRIKKEIIIRKNAMRVITVREGDTLGSIARRAYGKASLYTKIYEANPDLLKNPHSLRVGMKLRVPK